MKNSNVGITLKSTHNQQLLGCCRRCCQDSNLQKGELRTTRRGNVIADETAGNHMGSKEVKTPLFYEYVNLHTHLKLLILSDGITPLV